MTDIAARNRAIKKTLAAVFGHKNVKVTGSHGTAYGYCSVRIYHAPRDFDQMNALRTLCREMLIKAGIDLGRRYTDDTCQTTCDEVSIRFNQCLFERVVRMTDDGRLYGKRWDCNEYIAL